MRAGMVVGLSRIIGQGAARTCLASAMVAVLGVAAAATAAEIRLVDDAGHAIRLTVPARRIVSLAPGSTELLYAAGAGDHVVGTVEYSDEPPAARALPRVGNAMQIDIERLAALKPDLVVAWPHGAALRQANQLQRMGIPLWISDPRRVSSLPEALLAFGTLAGTDATAALSAGRLRSDLAALRNAHARRAPLRVFVQIADRPLMTVNAAHLLADALGYCGGRNVFADAPALAPVVDRERVLAASPDVILLVAEPHESRAWADVWRPWSRPAAANGPKVATVRAGTLASFSTRTLDGLRDLCAELDRARGP